MYYLKPYKFFEPNKIDSNIKLYEQFVNNYNVDVIVKFIEEFSGYNNLRKIASGGNGYIFDYDNSDYYIKVTGSVVEMLNVRKLSEEKLINVMYINGFNDEYIEELDSEFLWFEMEKLDDLDYYHENIMDIFFRVYISKKDILDKLQSNNDIEDLFINSEYKNWYNGWKNETIEKHGAYEKFLKVIFDFKNGIKELRKFDITLTDVGLHNVMYDYNTNNLKIIDIGE